MAREFEWLPDVLRDAGLPIEVLPGFRDRGRPYPMNPWGCIWHHTASPIKSTRATNISVVTNGNAVAPGPIAHVLSAREQPRLVLVAAGYCNNAGKGWWPAGQDSGNKRAFACEWVNNGVGEQAHPESVEVTARMFAEVHMYMDWPLDRLWTHQAYAPGRKIDPAAPADFTGWQYRTWTLADVRGQVAKYMQGDVMGNIQFLSTPARHIDTRNPPLGRLLPDHVYPIPRHAEVPANATGLALNITVTRPAQGGFVKVWDGGAEPQTSVVNFDFPNQNIANFQLVKCIAGAYVIKTSCETDLIVDIVGYIV